ncbi:MULTISPECIES: hypothetical protein [Pseudomonas]|uniref:DUF2029 domain-containing protein n=1 Tax=Pseudomonas quercus TaxID=2722792 RepID=A0ABX0YFE9_9PSED|nr:MULTISPECIES: hypothetical protein [Pseudomonas]MBF7143478.1 hypothetical protein [Pseudomonas sp. LY10J]NJP02144.1 hypothetical protein [Pseudomonas quercus]
MRQNVHEALKGYSERILGPVISDTILGEHKGLPKFLFFFVVILYFVYMCLMQGHLMFAGEMWAEMATNYFAVSKDGNLFQKFFELDSGYIPLLPRIIAFAGDAIGFPAASMPYFYTWTSVLLTGCIVGAFCLRPFRAVVPNDILRFFCALIILLVADYETRTFINFTYFGIFLISVVTALSLSDSNRDVPRWCWLICFLILSKPAIVAVVPSLILAAIFAKRRFRLVATASIMLCCIQLIQMVHSHANGGFVTQINYSSFQKIDAGFRYSLGFLGGMLSGKKVAAEYYPPLIYGSIALFMILLTFCLVRRRSNSLLIIGLGLLLMNFMLNAFALSSQWNVNMENLPGVPLYRHTIVGFFGTTLIVTGWISTVFAADCPKFPFLISWLKPLVLALWFFVSGWAAFSVNVNKAVNPFAFNNSKWQEMSSAIDSGAPVCVPIDPLGWQFLRGCTDFTPNISWVAQFDYEKILEPGVFIPITMPQSVSDRTVMSVGVLLKPQSISKSTVQVTLVFQLKSGAKVFYSGQSELPPSGGLILLAGDKSISAQEVQSVQLMSSQPIRLASIKDDRNTLAVSWSGR